MRNQARALHAAMGEGGARRSTTRTSSIGLKWVYKVKRDEHGAIVKHKAHLVARGFVQREGIDFKEVFTPVARMESVQLLLALAAAKDCVRPSPERKIGLPQR